MAAAAASSASLIDSIDLLDEDEQPVTTKAVIGDVSAERREVWSTRLASPDDLVPTDGLVAVKCTGGRGPLEHAVRIRDGSATPLLLECKVSYEELPPAALVEYQFADGGGDDGKWHLSMVCLEYLLAFRAGKFADWEKRLLQPTCKAEFRRMVAIGPVYNVFDHHMFPSAEEDKSRFEVTDDNGRKVILPRPVAALRIWDVEKQAYEDVDPTLDGAPAVGPERETYWANMIEKLKENFPEETEECLAAAAN
eukprot:CAMPEP_0178610962 /NCGR_PEP_ID=MMETSP0698-20121128/366_1 /TAXON_ID=265572 /ORGANISM="Extubocellulus spinifer, Strain CCMP396" /LENGTH=251 /DNA_ID=CAMNT_0020249577 /DNA_START=14 /DNA_END=769 /DNA_ORIENTATION=+